MKNNLEIKIKIITPEKLMYENKIYQVTLPVKDGLVTILPNHRSYIAALNPGELIVRKNKNDADEENIYISGGFIEFNKNNLVVLADTAERVEEIDIERAEEAVKRAEEVKNRKSIDEDEYARVAAALEKELVKIKVAKRHRVKPRINLQ